MKSKIASAASWLIGWRQMPLVGSRFVFVFILVAKADARKVTEFCRAPTYRKAAFVSV